MDFNLIGKFWRWPVNLSGNATGNDSAIIRPSFDTNISNLNVLKDTNISDFNIFNFSCETTTNLTYISIITVISVTILISYFLIKVLPERTLSRSKDELCSTSSSKQEKLNVYSRLCGQKILIGEYVVLFKVDPREALIENIIIINKDLMELIGLALILIPANKRADLDSIDDFGKRIRKIFVTIANIHESKKKKSAISFNELDDSTEELKISLQKIIERLLEEIEPKPKEKQNHKSGRQSLK